MKRARFRPPRERALPAGRSDGFGFPYTVKQNSELAKVERRPVQAQNTPSGTHEVFLDEGPGHNIAQAQAYKKPRKR
jgi:hypothetical protein